MAENERHYCMVAMPREAEGNTRAALLNEFKWPPGTTVRVRFLEGDPELQKRVQGVAEGWTGPEMANLQWQFGDDPDADIRVAFEQGNGSWSYLGTMCQQIPAPEPTPCVTIIALRQTTAERRGATTGTGLVERKYPCHRSIIAHARAQSWQAPLEPGEARVKRGICVQVMDVER